MQSAFPVGNEFCSTLIKVHWLRIKFAIHIWSGYDLESFSYLLIKTQPQTLPVQQLVVQ